MVHRGDLTLIAQLQTSLSLSLFLFFFLSHL